MSYLTEKQIFYINSRNRDNGTDSNFNFTLTDLKDEYEYDKVAVLDCSIPKSYYVIQNGYNTFILSENGTEVTITIDEGNYNRNSLRLKIQSKLNLLSPNNYIYSVTNENINLTQDNGKFTFSVSNNGGIQPILIFSDYLYEQFGFNKNSNNQFVSNSLVSTNVVNLNKESTLFIRSDICSENNNILQNINTVQDPNYSYIVFENKNIIEYSKNYKKNNKKSYNFMLTDEDNNIINLNGLNIVMTIMVYKSTKINELMTGYIKYKTLLENNFLKQ